MDIHRCRFVPYPPHSINALAFSHPSNTKLETPTTLRLAVGRGNGDIEIWNPHNGKWFQESILRGGRDRSIEAVAWIEEPNQDDTSHTAALRLFSIGGSSSITEWDLAKQRPKGHVSGNAGDIWCIAAQSQMRVPAGRVREANSTNEPSQLIAAGCSNGEIVLFSTEDNDLQYLRTLAVPAVKKPKVLSITWRDRTTVVAGYEDSTIRVYNITTRTTIRNMSLGSSPQGGDSFVWCVKCLPDGTIISGDSSGELKIWEPKNLSLLQRLKTHEADILDVGTSYRGDRVFSVGVDRRTVVYQRKGQGNKNANNRWGELMHRRYHQHDVKCLSIFESKDISVMASGGVDTALVISPVRESQSQYHRSLGHLPHQPQVVSAMTKKLFMTWWDREVRIWQVKAGGDPDQNHPSLSDDRRYAQKLYLQLKDEENITSADLSADGKLVAVSTSSTVKLFQLRERRKAADEPTRCRQIPIPASLYAAGAKMVKISPDGRWLCAIRPDNTLVVGRIRWSGTAENEPAVLGTTIHLTRKAGSSSNGGLGDYATSVSQLAFSLDSRTLVSADLTGALHTWILDGNEDVDQEPAVLKVATDAMETSDDSDSDTDDDSPPDILFLGQRWIRHPLRPTLPSPGSPVLVLSFRPTRQHSASVTSDTETTPHSTRSNPHPLSSHTFLQHQKLMVITADHSLIEYDLETVKFSDWTRRNPVMSYPEAFTRIKDRTMGCFWDISSSQDRLWLYGFGWIFMFDMSKDFPRPQPLDKLGKYEVILPEKTNSRKRAFQTMNGVTSKKLNTGAGGEMVGHDKYLGSTGPVATFKAADSSDIKLLENGRQDDEILRGLEELSGDQQIVLLDSNGQPDALSVATNGNTTTTHSADEASGGDLSSKKAPMPWWFTFNYRSILGIVPLSGMDGTDPTNEQESSTPMEVVMIERPTDEIGLTPRFDSGKHWDS